MIDCDTTWRVISTACWIEYYSSTHFTFPPAQILIRRPCDSVECCSVGLRVCRFEDQFSPLKGRITIDTLGSVYGAEQCSEHQKRVVGNFGMPMPIFDTQTQEWVMGYTFTTYDCEEKCNWLSGLVDLAGYNGFGKIAFDYDVETTEYYGIDEINIKIKFNEDFVDFYINSDMESQNLNISLYSVYGNKLISNTFGLMKGDNYYQMNTNKLVTGMYLISIQVNGSLLKTEKLLIIR